MAGCFEYIMGNRGIEDDATYPLGEVQYPCHFNSSRTAETVVSYGYARGETEILQALVAYGPIAISISAVSEGFFFYSDGIFDDPDCGNRF